MWIKCLAEGQKVPGIDGNCKHLVNITMILTWNPRGHQVQNVELFIVGFSTRVGFATTGFELQVILFCDFAPCDCQAQSSQ